ncbi:MAG: hypothetical protein LZF62_480221 [Nitrospira sp.]|nr:MAG: hypothetical protein LZF62_480221 [Nitrospira sp.]
MHYRTLRCAWGLATVLILMSWGLHPTEAALVTYQFTGTVSGVTGSVYTAGGSGADGFDAGLNLSGRYTFDTMAPHMNPPPPPSGAGGASSQQGYYPGSIRAFDFMIGTYASGPQTAGGSSVSVGDLGARYRVDMALLGDAVKGGLPALFTIDLFDSTGTAFSSVALPTSQPPSLASFNSKEWRLLFTGGSTVVGRLDSLTPVPLPAAALLFLPGLLGLGVLAHRRRT